MILNDNCIIYLSFGRKSQMGFAMILESNIFINLKLIIITILFILLFGCSGGGGGKEIPVDNTNESNKTAVFGEAQYDAGYVFNN